MKYFGLVSFCGILFAKFSLALSPTEIISKADLARAPSGTFSMIVKIEERYQGKSEKNTIYKVYSKGAELTRIETLSPERQKGRKLLMQGSDLWLYLPTIKRPTRVSLQQRLTGQVANGDIARTNYAIDYSAELVGEERVEGRHCHKLQLAANRKDVTYGKITYWVEKSSFLPVKAEFHALSGKLLKTGTFSDPKQILGKNIVVTKMRINDALQPDRESELLYGEFQNESLSDAFFNKESLTD